MVFNATARRLIFSLTCLVAAGSLVCSIARAEDGPPPLTGPEGSAPEAPMPIPAPVAPQPAPAPARPARDDRPVLALPGITTPPARSRPVVAPLPPPSLSSSPDGGLPPLEMPGGKTGTNASTMSTPDLLPLPSERFRGRDIVSTPIDGIPPLTAPVIPRSSSTPGRARAMSSVPSDDSPVRSRSTRDDLDLLEPLPMNEAKDLDKEKDKEKKPEVTAPRRSFGLFNRWMPRPTAEVESGSGIKVEPRTDPAADAAIKRRIERQANDAVGDRVRNIEVRVVGRSVTIQARGTKFLQRRAVKRALESLPGLSGYRSIVEVLD